jgi:aspartyl-tRNA(Asn)/glutamyl-tRNA(Gln) amidotransferase subunit C
MSITKKDVQYVAGLAHLQFSDSEVDCFVEQMGGILEYFKKLQDIDTTNVSPSTHAVSLSNAFREDETTDSLPTEEALKNAPETDQTYFKVPKIIEV